MSQEQKKHYLHFNISKSKWKTLRKPKLCKNKTAKKNRGWLHNDLPSIPAEVETFSAHF